MKQPPVPHPRLLVRTAANRGVIHECERCGVGIVTLWDANGDVSLEALAGMMAQFQRISCEGKRP